MGTANQWEQMHTKFDEPAFDRPLKLAVEENCAFPGFIDDSIGYWSWFREHFGNLLNSRTHSICRWLLKCRIFSAQYHPSRMSIKPVVVSA
jgi:hypothetical protein